MKKKNESHHIHLFENWRFTSTNYIIFGIGLALIIMGYVLMALGTVNSFQSLTLAPILLFFGYIVVIPFALIYRDKKITERITNLDH
jgi:hypothetical protein